MSVQDQPESLPAPEESPDIPKPNTDTGSGLRQALRFPITRIALFIIVMISLFLVLSWLIRHVDPLEYEYKAEALAALLTLWLTGRLDGMTLASFGLMAPAKAPRDLIVGLLIGALTMTGVVGAMDQFGWYAGSINSMTPALSSSLRDAAGIYLLIAISEELIYRGFLFQTLEKRWGSDVAFASTMVIFGLSHVTIAIHGADWTLRLIGALSIAVEAGILFTATYLLTRRLWMPIGVHWAWNFFQGPVFGAPVTGSVPAESIFRSHISGPPWATGGPFGPEASIPALAIGTAFGMAFLYLAARRRHRRETRE